MSQRTRIWLSSLLAVAIAIPSGIAVAQSGDDGSYTEPAPTPSDQPIYESSAGDAEPVYSHEPISDDFADDVRQESEADGVGSPVTPEEVANCEDNPGAGFCDIVLQENSEAGK